MEIDYTLMTDEELELHLASIRVERARRHRSRAALELAKSLPGGGKGDPEPPLREASLDAVTMALGNHRDLTPAVSPYPLPTREG